VLPTCSKECDPLQSYNLTGCMHMRAVSWSRGMSSSSWPACLIHQPHATQAPPLPSYLAPLPPSQGIILAYSFSPSSHLPSSFFNLYSSALHLKSRSIAKHLFSPPLFLAAALRSLLHSRSIHLFFTFCFPLFCTLGCCW
jgi:hypothetical protein